MENRWSERKDLALGVDIFHQGYKLATCQSKDIGLGGAYVDNCDVCVGVRGDFT